MAKALADGLVSDERWNSCSKLTAETGRHEEMSDCVTAAEKKRRIKTVHKAMRTFYRLRDSE